jgi:alpha-tubulin suppressor-like RCC1 family protein
MIQRHCLQIGVGLGIILLGGAIHAATIDLGYNQALAVTADGYVQAWGLNTYGQLGNGIVSVSL